MKIIPRKLKVKNTVWKCYSLLELLFILILSLICFILILNKFITLGIILIFITVILFIPTTDGIIYCLIYDLIKYLFSKRKYIKNKNIDNIFLIKDITDEGIIKYSNNTYSKVIKIGQKNFLLQDEETQENDIDCLNKALKQLDISITIDIIKIDQPINFDKYIIDLDNKIKEEQSRTVFNNESIKEKILKERKQYITSLNNEKKQYVSNYYIVLYSDNIKTLNEITNNFVYEIKKSGINTKNLNFYETALFVKYSYTKNFDEREIYKLNKKQVIEWLKPEEIKFYSNKFIIDNIEASVLTINDYPLKVKNGWGTNLFNIENTKVVMRIKPVEKYTSIRKIDKCILEMETRSQTSYLASETNYANIHKNSINELLNKIQAEDEEKNVQKNYEIFADEYPFVPIAFRTGYTVLSDDIKTVDLKH